MKIFKYLIVAILVISLTKKMHVFNDSIYDSGSIWYNPNSQIAFKQTEDNQLQLFFGVIAVNPTVTPPNLAIPALTFIATIPAPKVLPNHYGSSNKRNLFGILVQGNPTPVFDSETDKIIGFYWDQNKIVTLNKKPIFVAVMEQKQAHKYGFHALGPVWTWFDTPKSEKLLLHYGISTKQSNFKNLAQKIGYITKNKTTYTLFGVAFDPSEVMQKPAECCSVSEQQNRIIPK